jgi:hypothetical protein
VSAPGFTTALGTAPNSLDLGSLTLSDLGLEGAAGKAGLSIGPTGTVSPTTGQKGLDFGLSVAAKALGFPISQNLISLAAKLAPALAPFAAGVGPAGLLTTAVQLAHSLASATPGTIANLQANLGKVAQSPTTETEFGKIQESILSDAKSALSSIADGKATFVTNPDVAAALSNMGVPGYSFQGGYVFGGARAGAPGASLGQAPTTPAANLDEALTLTPTFAQLANAFGFGRTDVTGGAPTGPPAGQVAADAATAAATAGTGVSSGGAAGEGAPAGSVGAPGGSGDSPAM